MKNGKSEGELSSQEESCGEEWWMVEVKNPGDPCENILRVNTVCTPTRNGMVVRNA